MKSLQLFTTFFKIGAFTLGGGYAMIPLVQREVVDRRGWIAEEEFLDLIALAQSAPGVIAVNTAVFVGCKIAGWRGVVMSVLGATLPSFLIILLIAMCFTRFREYPQVEAVFKGIRPAVVALNDADARAYVTLPALTVANDATFKATQKGSTLAQATLGGGSLIGVKMTSAMAYGRTNAVIDAEIDGDTAKVKVTQKDREGNKNTVEFQLEKEDGKWKISKIERVKD